MRGKQSIAKVLSIVMLIVLTQKIAGGLYLHNWLHSSGKLVSLPANSNTLGQGNCSCIDDFCAAFTEAQVFSVESPLAVHADYFVVHELYLPPVSKHFHSLRAPPALGSFFS
jgi:hypothetical protein